MLSAIKDAGRKERAYRAASGIFLFAAGIYLYGTSFWLTIFCAIAGAVMIAEAATAKCILKNETKQKVLITKDKKKQPKKQFQIL